MNSTAAGGGVAEMIAPVVGYGRSLGIDYRWLVLSADEEFFAVTKRADNGISGVEGDGGPLGEAEHRIYEKVAASARGSLREYVESGDLVFLHDPQTVGLIPEVRSIGAVPIWRCHNGSDEGNEHTERSWNFLDRYLAHSSAYVFTMRHFCPEHMRDRPVHVMAPFIDPCAAKNIRMSPIEARRTLARWNILSGDGHDRNPSSATIIRRGDAPAPEVPMVVQVSRWDPVKDMAGVMSSFVEGPSWKHAYLSLIGPEVKGVADDPEASDYFAHCLGLWNRLPDERKRRVQLVCLPMDNVFDNALAVNSAQWHATVVAQKSVSEGFGLTVTEAMWKGAAVLASDVGGISLQIDSGRNGVLVDPHDREGFSSSLEFLLENEHERDTIGASAYHHVRENHLPDGHFVSELDLASTLVKENP
ncbi:glycosyltransferase [Nocardiopsis alba]|uniref:glycosyltransferase n=1 Tax=Nocardiopsis alba TaxID=53437 RepID=UPI003670EC0B